ncbi:MAG: hypothetical protein WC738_02595 [Candidatus Omnitrophota bacterium]
MRKSLIIAIALFAVTAFLVGGVFAEDLGFKITSLKGKVLVKKAGSEEWIAAQIGQILNKNDAVKTLEDGMAYIEFSPNTGFTLKPNSLLVLTDDINPPIAEPYTEAGRESRETIDNVMAPAVNQDNQASQT